MTLSFVPAREEDAAEIAALHAESWRTAYRGLLPDAFLDGPVFDNRLQLWTARMVARIQTGRFVLKAVADGKLVGFVCVLLDAEPSWGALLDNLHVEPGLKGQGIGHRLFREARAWVAEKAPGERMHLTVIEGNRRREAVLRSSTGYRRRTDDGRTDRGRAHPDPEICVGSDLIAARTLVSASVPELCDSYLSKDRQEIGDQGKDARRDRRGAEALRMITAARAVARRPSGRP